MTRVEFYRWWDKWKSKPSKIDKVVEYINQQLKNCSAVGLHLPDKLTDRQWRQLREHFECHREFLGFINFSRLKENSNDK